MVFFVFFLHQCSVPQSSAVIKQLKGNVNWDDGIENEMNLWVCVHVSEYFGAMCVCMGGAEAYPQTETDVTQWLWMPLFTFRNSLARFNHTSLLLPTRAPPTSGEISGAFSLSKRKHKRGKYQKSILSRTVSVIVKSTWIKTTLRFNTYFILLCTWLHKK